MTKTSKCLLIFHFSLIFPLMASDVISYPYNPPARIYPKPFLEFKYKQGGGAYMDLAGEILRGWGLYHDEATDQLYQKLRTCTSKDVFHILNHACQLAARHESSRDKSEIALELSPLTCHERNDVAEKVLQLKHADNMGHRERATIDLVSALCAGPAYKRDQVYFLLQQPEAYQQKSAYEYALHILKKPDCLLDTWQRMRYWVIQPIYTKIWPIACSQNHPGFDEMTYGS